MVYWKETVRNYLKSELIKRNLSHEGLVSALSNIGIIETKASIDNKISRGSFSAVFLLQCLHAIDTLQTPVTYPTPDISFTINSPFPPSYQYELFDQHYNNYYTHSKLKLLYKDITKPSADSFINNKVISLFSGAGGLDIGLENAGFETVVCVEIDADCRETLLYNRPRWKLFENDNNRIAGDIRSIYPEEILEFSQLKKGEAALVIGGAPCQPFSNIGMKKGENDPNNGDLFLEFVKIVKGTQPRAFIFENVVGITQTRHTGVINYMKEKLSGLGYGISYTVLNAANYGVAQRRERFFLLGIQNVLKPAFPLPTHFKGLKEWQLFINNLDRAPKYVPEPWSTLSEVLNNIPDGYESRSDHALMNISDIVVKRMELIKPGENFKVLPLEMRPDCWKSGKHQGQDTFGRLKLDEPSVTIRTAAYNPAKGKYIHPTENRGLNTIEMAAIQGFPFDWHFKTVNRKNITLKSGGMQIGNAVPPLLAQALGLAIKAQLTKSINEEFDDKPPQLVSTNSLRKLHQQQPVEHYEL